MASKEEIQEAVREVVAQEVDAAIGTLLGRMWNREVRDDAAPDWRGSFKGTLITTANEAVKARQASEQAVALLREAQ